MVLVSGCLWLHRMSLKVFFSSPVFWKGLRRISTSSLNVWYSLPVKSSGPECLFLGNYYYYYRYYFTSND